jgi:hypothetical protein
MPKQPIATKPLAQSQRPVATVKSPKPTAVKTKPPPQKNDKQLIQSRSLSNNRAQRAQAYRQHHAISKFGTFKHEARADQPVANVSQQPLTPTYKPSEELAVQSVIQQVYRPTASISHHLADSDRRNQPAPEPETDRKQKSSFSWLNPSTRTMKIATVTMSVIVLSAYIAYLNAPNISVRIAASRAGIDAQLPGYMPSGFTLDGPVEYETGRVVLNFGAGADERNFSIVEEESRWNSESLRENAVSNASSNYETIRHDGLTIYIYNGSNASWVNQGIKYTLSGDSQLSEEQITKIATSL